MREEELLTTLAPAAPPPVAVERLLVQATREVRVLGALTPVAAAAERSRLTAAVQARRRAAPRWTYAPVAHDALRRALDAAERELAGPDATPLEELYLGRVRELSLEASMCAVAGTPEVARLARARFDPMDADGARAAARLCASWLAEPPPQDGAPPEFVVSDADDPRSLLSRMRSAVGRLRLPFSVVTHDALAPLAATGERVILVARGRLLREEDAERTVLHEVEGHVLPRARAELLPLAIFRAGTARGTDDQEGRALLLEERAGLLGPRRRRQLAARHRCVEAMLDGASFEEAARTLVDAHGLDPAEAVLAAERAFRGGNGEHPGLGRERVYLDAFLRIRAHFGRSPEDEAILANGQIAVGAVALLRARGRASSPRQR
jgi:hypothetical protein